jgi:REP element-mobilizing transposase RayT
LASRHPVFVTLRVGGHVEPLRSRQMYPGVLRALMAASGQSFRVVEFSVQEDHIHLICEATDRDALSRGMQGLGVRLARAINRAMSSRGKVFSDRYHDRILRTPREVRFALRYVLLNARKHRALPPHGQSRCVDPFSSAAWFAGWRTRIELPWWASPRMLQAERPTARARTWLLKTGWRIHGRLDPGDCPKGRPP